MWSISLPSEFARRVDDGDMVLWRPGLTMWLAAWGNDRNEAPPARLASINGAASSLRFAERESTIGLITRYGYRLRDRSLDGAVESLNAYAIAPEGHLQISIYLDDVADEAIAWQLADSAAIRGQA